MAHQDLCDLVLRLGGSAAAVLKMFALMCRLHNGWPVLLLVEQ